MYRFIDVVLMVFWGNEKSNKIHLLKKMARIAIYLFSQKFMFQIKSIFSDLTLKERCFDNALFINFLFSKQYFTIYKNK